MLSGFFVKKNFGLRRQNLAWVGVCTTLNFRLEARDGFSARWVGGGWILGLDGRWWITGVVVVVCVGPMGKYGKEQIITAMDPERSRRGVDKC